MIASRHHHHHCYCHLSFQNLTEANRAEVKIKKNLILFINFKINTVVSLSIILNSFILVLIKFYQTIP